MLDKFTTKPKKKFLEKYIYKFLETYIYIALSAEIFLVIVFLEQAFLIITTETFSEGISGPFSREPKLLTMRRFE